MQRLRRVVGSKYFPLFLLAFFFILPLLLYLSYYVQDRYLFAGDSFVNITKRDMYLGALRSGEVPLWNKFLSNGVPVADSVFRPFLLLTSFLSTKDYAYVEYALHLAIGATFLYLYLREIGCNQTAALLAALLYELSVHLGGVRKEHNMVIDAVVYLPVILFFLHRYYRTNHFIWLVLSSLSMALQFYDGMIQHTLYTDIAAFFYLLFLGIHHRRKAGRLIAEIAVWGFLYAGLIAPRLLALADTMMQYGANGASSADIEFFKGLSIHWLKAAMLLFPKSAGDVHNALGDAYSSGMDIEIFLGVAVFFVICTGAWRFRKNFYVRMSVLMMLISFVYAANAHIPYLSEILYRIPVLGGFRVPSRMLFVFDFFAYVLLAISLTKIQEERQVARLVKPALIFSAIAVIVCLTGLLLWGAEIPLLSSALRKAYPSLSRYFLEAFLPSLVVVALLVAVCFAARFLQPRLSGWRTRIFPGLLCVLLTACTLAEVLPFTLYTTSSPVHDTDANTEAVEAMAGSIGTHKAWSANIDYGKRPGSSLLSNNKGQAYGIASINSYLSFNNPNLYKLLYQTQDAPLNASGLYAIFPMAERNLTMQNDLLSMLGVKYIADPFYLIDARGEAVEKQNSPERLSYTADRIDVTAGDLFVAGESLGHIPEESTFAISFTAETEAPPEFLYVDFYSNNGHHVSERTLVFQIQAGSHAYSGHITSGTMPSDAEDVLVRVVAQTEHPIAIESFELVEIAYTDDILCYAPYSFNPPVVPYVQNYDISGLVEGETVEVLFTASAYEEGLPEYFYVDLYGEDYDNPSQDLAFAIKEGTHTYRGFIHAVNFPDGLDALSLRILVQSRLPIEIRDFFVLKASSMKSAVYTPFLVNDTVRIYENTNAQEVLYVPEYVVSIDDLSGLYTDSLSLDLLSNSYVQGVPDMDLTEANAQVTVDAFGYNSIEGRVVSEQPAYLNFSQNYFEGWQAYVNGVRTPIYLTNGVIQGIEIPAGESTVRFVYVPQLFYVGLVILGVTVVLTGLGLVLEGRRRKRRGSQGAGLAA